MLVLLAPSPAVAQGWSVEARAGVVLSTTWVEDEVASPGLAASLGDAFGGPVRARPEPGILIAASALGPLGERTGLELSAGWSRARLGIAGDDDRTLNTFQTAHALVGARYRLGPSLHAGLGVGALRTWGDALALFANRAETSPLGEASLALERELAGARVVLRGAAQMHRFDAAGLEGRGAEAGWAARYSVSAGVAFGRPAW